MRHALVSAYCALSALPGLSARQALLRAHAAFRQQQEPSSPFIANAPADGDTFVGELVCSYANVGLKVKVEKFPEDLRLEVFPQSYYDQLMSHRFCRPLTSCNQTVKLVPSADDSKSDVVTYNPAPGSTELSDNCGWPDLSLTGGFGPDSFRGGLNGEVTLRARPDIAEAEPGPMACSSKEKDIHQKGGSITCSRFHLEKCQGAPPGRGEKAVFMVLTTVGDQTGGTDGFLTQFGRRVAANLPLIPQFDLLMSDDPEGRAGVIMAAPTARAMQTAYLAFAHTGINIVLDANLMTHGDQLNWNRDNGERVLKEMKATSLLEQYRALYETTNEESTHKGVVNLGSNTNRMARFRQVLLHRPEQRIIVIGHRTVFEDIQMIPRGLGSAAMEIRVLSRNGQWRPTSEPRCWS